MSNFLIGNIYFNLSKQFNLPAGYRFNIILGLWRYTLKSLLDKYVSISSRQNLKYVTVLWYTVAHSRLPGTWYLLKIITPTPMTLFVYSWLGRYRLPYFTRPRKAPQIYKFCFHKSLLQQIWVIVWNRLHNILAGTRTTSNISSHRRTSMRSEVYNIIILKLKTNDKISLLLIEGYLLLLYNTRIMWYKY